MSMEDARVQAVVKLANCLKTESRVKMLWAMKKGATRPMDVIRKSGENPSTIYRIVDEMIEAGVVERRELGPGQVAWNLTDLGRAALDAMERVTTMEPLGAREDRERPRWIHFVLPSFFLILSGMRGLQDAQAGWFMGGAILATASYLVTTKFLD
jgi:DNA-binding HxlR family transcriptional regulator